MVILLLRACPGLPAGSVPSVLRYSLGANALLPAVGHSGHLTRATRPISLRVAIPGGIRSRSPDRGGLLCACRTSMSGSVLSCHFSPTGGRRANFSRDRRSHPLARPEVTPPARPEVTSFALAEVTPLARAGPSIYSSSSVRSSKSFGKLLRDFAPSACNRWARPTKVAPGLAPVVSLLSAAA